MNPDQIRGSPRFSLRGRGLEGIIRGIFLFCASVSVVAIFFILFYLIREGYPAFLDVGILQFLLGPVWDPTASQPQFGLLPLITATLLVTLGAMAFAVPLGIGTSVGISELAPRKLKYLLKPAVELLAGIPSVVYGFFGLILLTALIQDVFDVPSGESWLAGSLILGTMALPTIVSVAEDAISAVPREFREGSLAIGATRWETISHIVIPTALPGITAAIILGIGRAIGETMAVLMVTGNAAVIPAPFWNVLSPVRTMTGTLGIEMCEVAAGSLHYHALFGLGLILLIITLSVNVLAAIILRRLRSTPSGERGGKQPRRVFLNKDQRMFLGKISIPIILILLILASFLIAGLMGTICLGVPLFILSISWKRIGRSWKQKMAFAALAGATVVALAILCIIIADIVVNGLPAMSGEFLTAAPRDLGRAGGIFPAIVGTIYLVAGAIAIALPPGVGAAIYLTEYTHEGYVTRVIRAGADLLNGTPSIVFGLFGFVFFVLFLGFGISLLAGQVSLALMVLPTIIRTTEESLKTVPHPLREGSFALGATRWQTIRRVVLPAALPGIVTGTILSIGRAAGETAPIMFTAVVFSQRFLPSSLLDPVMALPYHLFILTTNVPGASTNKYGTALVLLLLVIAIYTVAVLVRTHSSRIVRW